jgi:hypothetical protein
MSDANDISVAARAARLKAAREVHFPSAADAARALGYSPVTVRAHESGQNGYPIASANAYANAYGVTANWLLMGAGDSASTQKPTQSPMTLTAMPSGKARLELNMVLPMALAVQIVGLVQEGGK